MSVLSTTMAYIQNIYVTYIYNSGIANMIDGANMANDFQTIVPHERWDIERAYSPTITPDSMTMYTRFGAFLSAVMHFDANAFGTPRNEAIAMDPQQRLLLEEVGMALDHTNTASVDMYSQSTGRL